MNAAVWLMLAALAPSGTRIPYGGEVTALTWRVQPSSRPYELSSAADLLVTSAVYETLYTRGDDGRLTPVLAAGSVQLGGRTLSVPLQTNVPLHEGRTLVARDVLDSITALAAPRSPNAHIALAIAGARASIEGRDSALRIRESDGTLRIELAEDYPPIVRLLASPRAAIHGVAHSGRPASGSGAFRLEGRADAVKLVASDIHAEGRPFLDEIRIQRAVTRFGAERKAKTPRSVVIGLPNARAETKKGELAPTELIVLSVGGRLRDPALLGTLSAALSRRRLARKFVGTGAAATTSLSGRAISKPNARARAPKRMVLLLPDDGPSRRFAERVQLDLLKAGISVVIESIPRERMHARRHAADYDLALERLFLEGAPTDDAIDRFHRLLSIAAHRGVLTDVVPEGALASFHAAAGPAREARLLALESEIMARAGLVPIVRRGLVTRFGGALENAAVDGWGAPRFENIFVRPKVGAR